MYILLSKTTTKTAVIKDKTEISGYINVPVRTVRRELNKQDRWEIGDYTIILADYVKVKSNSGGKREPKSNSW